MLSQAATSARADYLEGLKENVIVGHKIPAGTGLRKFDKLMVGNQEELDALTAAAAIASAGNEEESEEAPVTEETSVDE